MIKRYTDFINEEYSIWDLRKDNLKELEEVEQVERFDEDFQIAYHKELFDWLRHLLKEYGYGDSIELITNLFMHSWYSSKENKTPKEWVYDKLVKRDLKNMEFLKKLYSRFDELDSYASFL